MFLQQIYSLAQNNHVQSLISHINYVCNLQSRCVAGGLPRVVQGLYDVCKVMALPKGGTLWIYPLFISQLMMTLFLKEKLILLKVPRTTPSGHNTLSLWLCWINLLWSQFGSIAVWEYSKVRHVHLTYTVPRESDGLNPGIQGETWTVWSSDLDKITAQAVQPGETW